MTLTAAKEEIELNRKNFPASLGKLFRYDRKQGKKKKKLDHDCSEHQKYPNKTDDREKLVEEATKCRCRMMQVWRQRRK